MHVFLCLYLTKSLYPTIMVSLTGIISYYHSVLWPLFHYSPADVDFSESQWEAYKEANAYFCRTIASSFKEGDAVWVHDYHLMLLPKLLREALGQSAKIGFFLHTPFPTSEIFG